MAADSDSSGSKSVVVVASLEIKERELKLLYRLRSIKESSQVVLEVSNGIARGIVDVRPAYRETLYNAKT